MIAVLTVSVIAYDYFTDYVVLDIFWSIGKSLKNQNIPMDEFSRIILMKFKPPVVFLSIIFLFSVVSCSFQIPSIWYQFKVKTALCKSEYEEGLLYISPELVVNQ